MTDPIKPVNGSIDDRLTKIKEAAKDFETWIDEDGRERLTIHSQVSKHFILDNVVWLISEVERLQHEVTILKTVKKVMRENKDLLERLKD